MPPRRQNPCQSSRFGGLTSTCALSKTVIQRYAAFWSRKPSFGRWLHPRERRSTPSTLMHNEWPWTDRYVVELIDNGITTSYIWHTHEYPQSNSCHGRLTAAPGPKGAWMLCETQEENEEVGARLAQMQHIFPEFAIWSPITAIRETGSQRSRDKQRRKR
jgi:hypothetical protein